MAASRSRFVDLGGQFGRYFYRFFAPRRQKSARQAPARCPALLSTNRRLSTFNSARYNFGSKSSNVVFGLTSISVLAGGVLWYGFEEAKRGADKKPFLRPVVYAATPIYTDTNLPLIEPLVKKSKQFNFIADVIECTAPAVVCIEIQGRHPLNGATMTLSNGSGFIVRSDGLILTNAHVVANRDAVVVKLHDGRVFTGKIESIDLVADLATVRIGQNDLPTLKLGSSADLRPGEWVVAMGSPLSLSNTITTGVVSSVHRESHELGLRNKNMEYIQTDASITFGNSGGPLLNLDGEVIGINTMKVTSGISFAIPSDKVKEFLVQSDDSIRRNKGSKIAVSKRRYMGITMLTLTPSIILELQQRQSEFPTNVQNGVLVWKIVVGSPAYEGGLHPGDVITEINGTAVKSAADVYKALEFADQLKMVILRKQQKMAITITPQS